MPYLKLLYHTFIRLSIPRALLFYFRCVYRKKKKHSFSKVLSRYRWRVIQLFSQLIEFVHEEGARVRFAAVETGDGHAEIRGHSALAVVGIGKELA